MSSARAFCPGHITGFFEICPAADMLSTGSRGAGMCISRGATSKVELRDAKKQSIAVSLNGKISSAEVTKDALLSLLGNSRKEVAVSTDLELPFGQGFGMSAAGALSASLATASILGMDRRRAFEAAHVAEVRRGGGLGDVSAIHRGGVTVRKKPGLPPIGKVVRIDGQPEVVVCVLGKMMSTKSVLENAKKRAAINASGSDRVRELLKEPTLERLMSLSSQFAIESGLATRKIIDAMNAASKLGMASMSMLGNSVFAVGDIKGLECVLADFGPVFSCRVDIRGPRLL